MQNTLQTLYKMTCCKQHFLFIVDKGRNEGLTEQMSICVQYLHSSEIKEQFLGFMELDQLNAHALANTINCFLNSVGLDLTVSII
ncbi:hypothetical protein PR048_032584 [Dryococelus australis]|uniref:Uncharacterized protein n=1 Tax=Dryococelus australis TaxID=614101 RepID=A0ABQ9G2L9_9NEOP|nr:hypothetical protein PR048_032584 [Dryococelus australis]